MRHETDLHILRENKGNIDKALEIIESIRKVNSTKYWQYVLSCAKADLFEKYTFKDLVESESS
jgi:hypothetical protein